jgi:hypothetical protein
MGAVGSGDTLGANLPLDVMREGRDGQVYVADINVGSLRPWAIRGGGTRGFQMSPTNPLLKYGGIAGFARQQAFDPQGRTTALAAVTGVPQGTVGTWDFDDPWDEVSRIHGVGLVHHIVAMEHPYGIIVSNTGVQLLFNYENGQAIHVTKHRPQLVGSNHVSRLYGYDRHFHRYMIMDFLPQAGGVEVSYIVAYNPIPIVHHLQQPVAVREPRTGSVVRIFTRAIGTSGEGVAGVEITFTDEGVGDVAPQIIITDEHGWAEANYDGLAVGGAETITVSAEVPDDLFPGAGGQGAGFGTSQWTPDIELDFDIHVFAGLPVDSIIAEQVDWDQGTADPGGCETELAPVKVGKVTSASIGIQSGETGTPDDPVNGTFGGDIVPTSTTQILLDGQVWFGGWFNFPAGFDFSTSTDGLLLFRLGNDQTVNYIEVRIKHGGGSGHTGWYIEWPDETVTDGRHNFTAHSSGLISDDTWHFIQYYANNKDVAADAIQRLWIDDILLWELVDDAAQHLETAGAGALVSFTANEAIATATNTNNIFDEWKVFNLWEGGAPASQELYCQTAVWTLDAQDLLGTDAAGNKFIDSIQREAL